MPTLLQEHERRVRRKSFLQYRQYSQKRKNICCTCFTLMAFTFFVAYLFCWKHIIFDPMNRNTKPLKMPNDLLHVDDSAIKPSDTSIHNRQQKIPLGRNEAPPLNTCDEISYFIDQNDMVNANDLIVAGGQLLRPGILYEDLRVEFGEYYNFQACLPKYNEHHHFHNIEIQVIAKDGDPDLYISPFKMKPTKSTSTWISKSIGSEIIKLPSNVKEFPRGAQTLYVAIFGGGNKFNYKDYLSKTGQTRDATRLYATFSIIVTIKDRPNPYKNLRLRKSDRAFKKDIEHETWMPHDEE